jgi:hypothetical protein
MPQRRFMQSAAATARCAWRIGRGPAWCFPPANHEHRGWRLAAVQQLAREHAPRRVNAVETDDEEALANAALALSAKRTRPHRAPAAT